MNDPHGGKLVNRISEKKKLDLDNIDLEVVLDLDQVSEVRNIATGIYSPLEGYMNKDDFMSVVNEMKLSDKKTPWSVPIFFPLSKTKWDEVKPGSQILLKEKRKTEEVEIGVLNVEEKFTFDKDVYNKQIYGTTNAEHPGVAMINKTSEYVVGGEIFAFGNFEIKYPDFDQTPEETRQVFQEHKWKTIVGFQTRNPAHRAHEFIQKICLEFVDGLFINPIIGKKKKGDFKDEVILAVYTMLVDNFYPKASTHISIYNSRMNYAGPREAVFHAIVRKNFGCTHFIVGRDHAGVGDFYDKFAAHKIFDQVENLGMEIMKVSSAFYDRRAQMFTTEKASPFSEIYRVSPSGTQVRKFIEEKNYEALRQVMRDESLDVIMSFDEPFVS
ncbi:MAG TPA: sulfate adenylyltransferase [Candidatus Dojkabacteria bacterium]|jgi:sulfate adenylyltransferase